jgi:hypothetical protein|nr:MAG TPA: hypothetical protein [Caudoviricetes sp.]
MANVTSTKKKTITINNRIKVDDTVVRYQDVTIDSENPDDIKINAYYASGDGIMDLYKANRTAVREQEDAFEDFAFEEQEKIKSEQLKA